MKLSRSSGARTNVRPFELPADLAEVLDDLRAIAGESGPAIVDDARVIQSLWSRRSAPEIERLADAIDRAVLSCKDVLMYGMVNKSLQSMVEDQHGPEVWQTIKSRAGVETDKFISNAGYPDDVTYKLVGTCCEVLNISASDFLEQFGRHWILVTARQQYGKLLQAGGRTFGEFVANLPNFHNRIFLMFPNLDPPKFSCSDAAENSIHLH